VDLKVLGNNKNNNYCGKSPSVVVLGTNAFKDPVINFITPGTYYLRLRTSNSLKIT
jgi:hypothetical protein